MKSTRVKLNTVVGQLLGAGRMMDEGQDCQHVLVQLKAANAALEKLTLDYLKQNLQTCLKSSQKQKAEELIDKLITI